MLLVTTSKALVISSDAFVTIMYPKVTRRRCCDFASPHCCTSEDCDVDVRLELVTGRPRRLGRAWLGQGFLLQCRPLDLTLEDKEESDPF